MMLLVSPEQWAKWDKWFNYTLPRLYILILGTIFLFVGLIPFYVHNKITYTLFGVNQLYF